MDSKIAYRFEMLRKFRSLGAVPRIWNYLKYKTGRKTPRVSVGAFTPQIAALWVTMRCNLNCWFCGGSDFVNQKRAGSVETEATVEKVQRIFANPIFSNCLLVDLEGGEPLLVKELGGIVSFLSKRGHLVNTSTNGLLLAGRIAEFQAQETSWRQAAAQWQAKLAALYPAGLPDPTWN